MAKEEIPFWVFMIIGVVVTGFSLYVDWSTGTSNLTIFIYAGIVFFLIGTIKLLLGLIFNKGFFQKKPAKNQRSNAHNNQQSHNQRINQHRNQQPHNSKLTTQNSSTQNSPAQTTKQLPPVRCPRCKVKVHPKFKYCPNCGLKL